MHRSLFLVMVLALSAGTTATAQELRPHQHTWRCAFDDSTVPPEARKTWDAIDLSQIRFVFVVPHRHLRPQADSIQALIDRSIQIANDAAAARHLPESFRFAQHGELVFWDYDFPRFTTDEERSRIVQELTWFSGRDSTTALREQVAAETAVPATAANIKITFLYDGVIQDTADPTFGTADVSLDGLDRFLSIIAHETFGHLLGVGHTTTLSFPWGGQDVTSIMYPSSFPNRTYGWYDDTIRAWGIAHFSAVSTAGATTLLVSASLGDLFPSPVAAVASLRLMVNQPAAMQIAVYNMRGQRLLIIADQWWPNGSHNIPIDVSSLASGNYVLALEGRYHRETKPLVVLR